ncbi:hypothetical protein, partial [Stenotrophomonas maltophilia]|uniref:hypothetical protein n=1 Tax=Stenotrophomonas maltophilia TaxID=40324 RepID=UPI001C657B98
NSRGGSKPAKGVPLRLPTAVLVYIKGQEETCRVSGPNLRLFLVGEHQVEISDFTEALRPLSEIRGRNNHLAIGIEQCAPSILVKRKEMTTIDRKFEEGGCAFIPRLKLALRLGSKSLKEAPNQTRLSRVVPPPQQILLRVEVDVPCFLVAMREQPDVFESEAFHSS